MDDLRQRMTVIFGLVVGLCMTVAAGAEHGDCRAPIAIDPPRQLVTDGDANEWREKLDSYSGDVETYLVCLATYTEDNKDIISNKELNAIRASHTSAIKQAQRVADAWNKSYADYLKRYAEAGK